MTFNINFLHNAKPEKSPLPHQRNLNQTNISICMSAADTSWILIKDRVNGGRAPFFHAHNFDSLAAVQF
jgi:hypothetical protein